MRIILTGATGLVGRDLTTELLKANHEITALVRTPESARQKLDARVKLVSWNGIDTLPATVVQGTDVVIHLAGENVAGQRWSKERKKALRDSRVLSAESLKRSLVDAGVRLKLFFSASGVGFYGDRGDQVLSESDGPGTDFLAKLCVEWEAAADSQPADRIVKARFGVVLKKDDGFLGQVVPLFKRLGASRLGSGQQWMDWIHIDDLVQAIIASLTDPRFSGVMNFVSPKPVTNQTMTTALGKAIGAWPGPPAPQFALRLLYGELADALLFSQRALPAKLESMGFVFKHADLNEALRSALR